MESMDTPALKPPDMEPAKRRYSGPPVAEIAAGGDYAETFWIRLTMTFDDYAALEAERRRLNLSDEQDLVGYVTVMMLMAGRMLERWTLCDSDGNPVPCTADSFRALDTEMISPVVSRVADFLDAKMRARTSAKATS